jgi:glycosyltransferase involved in cell wall biosynthesis
MNEASEALQDRRPAVVMLLNSLAVGGAERQTIAIANLLVSHFRIVLAYLKPDESLGDYVCMEHLTEVHCLRVESRIDLRAGRELAALAAKHDAPVILCANPYALMYAQIARAMSQHPLTVVEVLHMTRLRNWKERLEMIFYRPVFWTAHDLVYVCGEQRRYWRRRGLWARQTHMIYNGVDVGHFDPTRFEDSVALRRNDYGFSSQDRVVGICAVLRPEKAHIDLLRAVARLKIDGQNWKVLIIGDGPLRPLIEQEIVKVGLAGSVVITGYQADVRGAISACDVLALVSTAETFSIAALEAMAMARPMIMSDIGGAREQVAHGQNGFLFPAGDVPALADCLRRCLDPVRLVQMGVAARERVQREFSQQIMVERYADLLESILSRDKAKANVDS